MSELEPGPELDALVAEKVMGWKRLEPDTHHKFGFYGSDPQRNPEGTIFIGTQEEYGRLSVGGSWLLTNQWSPSTSIADAWEVVEKMQSMNNQRDIHIECLLDKWSVSMCHFERDGESMEWGDWTIDANTAPHAICLAALKAVGATE